MIEAADLSTIYRPITGALRRVIALYREQLASNDRMIRAIGAHLSEGRGKMFRPALVLLSAGIRGRGHSEQTIRLAAAVELIHVASLVHDDIVDGADLRRSRSTIHSEWGEEISVVVGDYLYAKGFQLLVQIGDRHVLEALSDTTRLMCEGQLLEMGSRCDLDLTERAYLEIITKKTARLIADCCELGGRLGGSGASERVALATYGVNLGMAFQIVDDCLDVSGNVRRLGKPLGSDLREGKVTLPLIHYTQRLSAQQRQRVIKVLSNGHDRDDFETLRGAIAGSEAVRTSAGVALRYVERARRALEPLEDGAFKEGLLRLVDYVVQRKH